jgi:hypothetical protein
VLFTKRLYDMADYDIGYVFDFFGIIKVRHVKVSKIYESPRFKTTIWIFGVEYKVVKDR